MTTPPTVEDPWPTLEDALVTAEFVAEQAQKVYGDLLEGVWLFGSRARGDHRPDSDLDLLVVKTSKEDDPRDHLRRELHRTLLKQFDVEMWGFLSLQAAYSEQMRDWDTMFYRNVRADALPVR